MRVRECTIEQELIEKLDGLKYTLRPDLRDRAALEANFRRHFEALNRVNLTDTEFHRLLEEIVTPDVFTAAHTLRHRNAFTRDDGTPLNYTLVNIGDWCKNTFEVASQFRINNEYSYRQYDVLLLINGVPAVQIELKTLGINPRRAIEQIVEYKNDASNGYARTLLCFIQLFIVSNRDATYYFANNNARHFAFNAEERFLPIYQYAAPDNSKISGLDAFADAFLPKCTLGQMISRYMVLVASEQKLLMMRPYQIYAVKNIVECIDKNLGNGYIWHTTGSGKTLTSFKASTLLKANPAIEKCLFVVDRKDLDRQTREEFNRFQEGCVEENTNTESLVRRLVSDDAVDKVIVTTIQKLGRALDPARSDYRQRLEPLRDQRMVFIFDECHRSQFGENHQAIKEFFPRAQLFGFTGTPIFEDNASYKRIEGDEQTLKTTEDLFQQPLHEYTITHAIEDRNVLRFHVEYYKPDGKHAPKPGETLAKRAVVDAILGKHDAATGGRRFNAILATASINDAIEYEFRDAPEWEEFTIQELIDRQFIVGHLEGNHGELYPRSDEFATEGIPYITSNDFKDGFVKFDYCKRLPMERARKFRKGVARDGDVLFAHNATVGPVAKLRTEEEFVILSTTATYFRCNQTKLVNDFLLSALASPLFVAQYTRVMSQSTRNQVPITAQRKFSLSIPKPPEQQRIADCLSSLDTQITAESNQLAALKTHKQGLMQQLFPAPAATGA